MKTQSTAPHLASRVDNFARELLEISNTSENDYLIIEPYSIGDTVHTLTLINAFRKENCHHNEKINLICNPRSVPVAKLFRNVDTVVGLDCSPFEFQIESFAERYGPCPRHAPIPMPPDMYARGWLGRLIAEGRISPIDAKRLILEINNDDDLYIPPLDHEQGAKAIAGAQQQGLTENSLIIFNHALSIKPLDSDVFIPLKNIWGDNIFFDATVGDRGIIPWANPIKIDLADIPCVADFAGTVLTIRSGITDLLSVSSKAKLLTVYPSASQINDFAHDKEVVAMSFMYLTLKRLGLDKTNRETPIFYNSSESLEALMLKIFNAAQGIKLEK